MGARSASWTRSTSTSSESSLEDVSGWYGSVDLEVAGEMAHEIGEAHLTLGSGTAVAKYVVVWKKADGQWRLHRDIWNTKAT
jgi:ketosteroid isomerase-like protein